MKVSVLQIFFFITLTIFYCYCEKNSKCDSKNGFCNNKKEYVDQYEDQDEEMTEESFEKYSAKLNRGYYKADDEVDDNEDDDSEQCLTPEFVESGISKISLVPTFQRNSDNMEEIKPTIIAQTNIYDFGSVHFNRVSQTFSEHNATQKINATIEVCYPKEKNTKMNICPIVGIQAALSSEANEENIKIISGKLYDILGVGEQICVKIKANNTKFYKVVVNFFGVLTEDFEETLLEQLANGEITEFDYKDFKKHISKVEFYNRLRLNKHLDVMSV
ncbi:uncharacterized protein LOC129619121 [Condylostylus longicornis]|uniref:uncharacterized protein LOC129619121 n=1 Tax=Condylostylus longicornis TaxID=2530218 RepID=UPI00244DABC3|nr:uncharacterized protein LOC129619121 [Condylostylus longicornis]